MRPLRVYAEQQRITHEPQPDRRWQAVCSPDGRSQMAALCRSGCASVTEKRHLHRARCPKMLRAPQIAALEAAPLRRPSPDRSSQETSSSCIPGWWDTSTACPLAKPGRALRSSQRLRCATIRPIYIVLGLTGNVALTCSGGPAHSTCTISPGSLTLNGTATAKVTLLASQSVNHGTFTLTFTGKLGNITHSTTVSLTVK
jgi:hypothetical protein